MRASPAGPRTLTFLSTARTPGRPDVPGRPGTTDYFEVLLASGDMLVLDESVLLEPCDGDEVVPSPLVPYAPVDWLDGSELLGEAGAVWPVGLVESPPGEPVTVDSAWPGVEPASVVADEVLLLESGAVWARAATDEINVPAAKNGTSLALSVMDASPVVMMRTVGDTPRAFHDPLVW